MSKRGIILGGDLPPELREQLSKIIGNKLESGEIAVEEDEHDHDHSQCIRPYPSAQAEAQAHQLGVLLGRLNAVDPVYKIGDRVQWKPGMRNRAMPEYGQPAIVASVGFEPIVLDQAEFIGRPVFMEVLDIHLGTIDEHGTLQLMHYDSRRFEPFKQD
jgi:hypothetical protein